MPCKIGMTIFLIVEIVALALFVIGTPLEMFKASEPDANGDTACLTMWGIKSKCSQKGYDLNIGEVFENTSCEDRKKTFQASEALSIITIVVYASCVILALFMCCCSCLTCCCRVILILVVVVGILTGAATFACMAYVYNNGATLIEQTIKSARLGETGSSNSNIGSKATANEAVVPYLAAAGSDSSGTSRAAAAGAVSISPTEFCDALNKTQKYGTGFILILVGWVLHTINMGVALLPI